MSVTLPGASLRLWGVRTFAYRFCQRVFGSLFRERAKPVGDATDIVNEAFSFAPEGCHLVLQTPQLSVCVLGKSANAALRISDASLGFGVREPPGLFCALVCGDQNCRDLLPDPLTLHGSFGSSGCGSMQLREFAVKLAELLLKLSEPLIDDGAVVPFAGNWKAWRGFPRLRPISPVTQI